MPRKSLLKYVYENFFRLQQIFSFEPYLRAAARSLDLLIELCSATELQELKFRVLLQHCCTALPTEYLHHQPTAMYNMQLLQFTHFISNYVI